MCLLLPVVLGLLQELLHLLSLRPLECFHRLVGTHNFLRDVWVLDVDRTAHMYAFGESSAENMRIQEIGVVCDHGFVCVIAVPQFITI